MGDLVICSASPELFFRRVGRELTARPMKGTARRGRTLAEDRLCRDRLRASPKECAENVMIVDMMRNDIGRVAAVGTRLGSRTVHRRAVPNRLADDVMRDRARPTPPSRRLLPRFTRRRP